MKLFKKIRKSKFLCFFFETQNFGKIKIFNKKYEFTKKIEIFKFRNFSLYSLEMTAEASKLPQNNSPRF